VTPLPEGFGLTLDRSVRRFRDGRVLVGGHPGRLVTLSADGVTALAALLDDRPVTAGARGLAGRLVAAGLAHPRRTAVPPRATRPTVTVVVPARDRVDELESCLASLTPGPPVLVIDDGSDDPAAVAERCAAHGARVLRRDVNGGPAAARNEAIAAVDTDLVAFVDSDCTVEEGWLEALVDLFEDPGIAAVAPRILPGGGTGAPSSALERYAGARSPLDMGPAPGEVGPERLVRYVPTAALVVRRAALSGPPDGPGEAGVPGPPGPGPFDPALRVGEDVDLVWRLVDQGWRIRYQPSVSVHHREPTRWRRLLARRYRYGTSAGALARRHPGRLAPVDLRPWPTAVASALVTGRPRAAVAGLVAAAVALDRELGDHGIPFSQVLRWSAGGVGWTLIGVARAATMVGGPVMVAGVVLGPRRARVLGTLALVGPPAVEWWRRRPPLDPFRWIATAVADDMAYGLGVWAGCIAARTWSPLVPSFHRSWSSASSGPAEPGTLDPPGGGSIDAPDQGRNS